VWVGPSGVGVWVVLFLFIYVCLFFFFSLFFVCFCVGPVCVTSFLGIFLFRGVSSTFGHILEGQ